jgi:hypothetical protein
LCAATLAVHSSCGRVDLPGIDLSGVTCETVAPAGYLLGAYATFAPAQLTELIYPSATYIAVMRVGQSTELDVSAGVLGGRDDCTDRITSVAWATSADQVASVRATGRVTAALTAVAPGEVTVQARADFQGATFDVPWLFARYGPRVRAVRVVP